MNNLPINHANTGQPANANHQQDQTPPSSPLNGRASPGDSPRTPVGAAHAILQAAAPPPLHHGIFHPAFMPAVTPAASPAASPTAANGNWQTPDWIANAAGDLMTHLGHLTQTLLPNPEFHGDLPALPDQQPGVGGLGDLQAHFPGLAPVRLRRTTPVMAPATPRLDPSGRPQAGAPIALIPLPQDGGLPQTPHAVVRRGGAFHGPLLPLFDQIAAEEDRQSAQRGEQAEAADFAPSTPTVTSPSVGASESPDVQVDSQPVQTARRPPDGAGPSNWWQP